MKLKVHGLEFHPLPVFSNEKGKLFHHVRKDSVYFQGFGEIYYSLTYPGVVKGWKFHKDISQIFTVISGTMKIVIYDLREESSTFGLFDTIVLGPDNYGALKIPPKVWYAFSPAGAKEAVIANVTSQPHSPGESLSEPLDTYLSEELVGFWG